MKNGTTNFSTFRLILTFCGGCVLLFLLAPLVGMFLNTSGAGLKDAIGDNDVRDSIVMTMTVSMVGTLAFSVVAIPFAYLLARTDFPGKKVLSGLIDLPIVIPHSAAGIALLTVLNRGSFVGKIAERCGFDIIGERIGIMLAMAFVSLPFLINTARSGFEMVPTKLENAALTLGASPLRVFFTISLPLAWRSVLTGLVMMWARGLSEFGAVIIIAYHPMTTPVMIFQRFNDYGLKYARPVAVLFVSICFAVFVLLRWLSGGERRARN